MSSFMISAQRVSLLHIENCIHRVAISCPCLALLALLKHTWYLSNQSHGHILGCLVHSHT